MQILSHFKLVILQKLHRHPTYHEIMVYHSRGPQLAKYTGKYRTLSLCYICLQNFSNTRELEVMKPIKCKIFSRQLRGETMLTRFHFLQKLSGFSADRICNCRKFCPRSGTLYNCCSIDRFFLIHPRISRIDRKQMFTHLRMNGTSKINSAASVSNTRTLGRRLIANLKTKSKCAINNTQYIKES